MSLERLSWLGGAWVAAHLRGIAIVFLAVGVVWLALDLLLPARNGRARGRAALLSLAAMAFVAARAFYPADRFAIGFLLVVGAGLLVAYLARYGWNPCRSAAAPWYIPWCGVAVLLLVTALKCVELSGWPAIVNDYAAIAGTDTIALLEQGWPAGWYHAHANDLQKGGQSLLHRPILWALFATLGPNTASLRLAEVLGSTLALLFFGLWLLRVFPGWWGLVSLALYALSPWHLAQSRMGTFLSVSMAVGLAVLWLAERISGRAARWYDWAGLGLAAGLIGYGYAPMRVLYGFVLIVLGVYVVRHRRQPRQWWGALLVLVLLGGLLAVQTAGPGGWQRMFRTDVSPLATDTAIWHKDEHDAVTRARQPLPVVVEHLGKNARGFFEWPLREWRVQALLGPAFCFAALFAIFSLVRGWGWVGPLYFLMGISPALLVFPEMRRSFLVWPLVMAGAGLFLQGLLTDVERIVARRWWAIACRVLVGVGVACTVVHGLHLFAKENGPVGVSPSFGTIWRAEMIDELRKVLADHYVYVLNTDQIQAPVRFGLYDAARRQNRGPRYELIHIHQGQDLSHYVKRGEPVCFAVLEEAHRSWIPRYLEDALPGGRLEQRLEEAPPHRVKYSLYYCPAGSTPTTSSDSQP